MLFIGICKKLHIFFVFFILKNTLFLPRLNFYTNYIYRAREKNQVYMSHLMEPFYAAFCIL